MNLKYLSDPVLLAETKKLVGQEREATTKVLHHLREVNSRRLYSALKCSSIFDYAVGELKYSESEAARRVRAMEALAAVPEIESKINSGELSLSNVALVQRAFFKSGKTLDRREMFKRVENKTTREAEKVIGVAPNRELSVEMINDDSLREKAKAVIGKYAHSKLSFEQVLHKIFDKELKDSPKCTHCGSSYALQVDHIIPKAKGGSDEPKNLRWLCRSCNQRAAINHFGRKHMQPHLQN